MGGEGEGAQLMEMTGRFRNLCRFGGRTGAQNPASGNPSCWKHLRHRSQTPASPARSSAGVGPGKGLCRRPPTTTPSWRGRDLRPDEK